VGELSLQMFSLVLPVARTWNPLGLGLACSRQILTIWPIIFFSLPSQQVVSKRVAPSYNLFGSFAFG
ncbi:hypothetical protein A2U01_0091312, partial [Trifolium medium]|nr:hypothetical protein [Trifolium medium]